MNIMSRLAAGLAMMAMAGAASAQTRAPAAARPCLNGPDAEAVFLAVAPAAIKAAAVQCTSALPRTAFLIQPDPAFLNRMVAASAAAWPRAQGAAERFAGPDLGPLFQSEAMRPALGAMLGALAVADLKPADCPKVDRMLTLLSPLPPRNIAALGVTILQYVQDDARRRGKTSKVPLCPANP